jgi:hypothetical protein
MAAGLRETSGSGDPVAEVLEVAGFKVTGFKNILSHRMRLAILDYVIPIPKAFEKGISDMNR